MASYVEISVRTFHTTGGDLDVTPKVSVVFDPDKLGTINIPKMIEIAEKVVAEVPEDVGVFRPMTRDEVEAYRADEDNDDGTQTLKVYP